MYYDASDAVYAFEENGVIQFGENIYQFIPFCTTKNTTDYFVDISSVEYGEYDSRRNKYSKTVTWKPVIYKTADEKNAVSQKEFDLDETAVQTRIKEIGVKKAYHYLFTGLNDQILKVDIKYKNAQSSKLVPSGTLGP